MISGNFNLFQHLMSHHLFPSVGDVKMAKAFLLFTKVEVNQKKYPWNPDGFPRTGDDTFGRKVIPRLWNTVKDPKSFTSILDYLANDENKQIIEIIKELYIPSQLRATTDNKRKASRSTPMVSPPPTKRRKSMAQKERDVIQTLAGMMSRANKQAQEKSNAVARILSRLRQN
jgi:hypothetical protein